MKKKLFALRRDADLAEHRLVSAQRSWRAKTRSIRTAFARHREAWLVGAGFTGGLVVALLPLRHIGRVASLFASAASLALRTPIGTLFADDARKDTPTSDAGIADTRA
jgi:hypothetical protein